MVANNSQCGEAEFAVKIKCFLIYERMAQADCKSSQIYYKTQSLCLYMKWISQIKMFKYILIVR